MTFKLNLCQVCQDLIPRAIRADGYPEPPSNYNKKPTCEKEECKIIYKRKRSRELSDKRRADNLIKEKYLDGAFKLFNLSGERTDD